MKFTANPHKGFLNSEILLTSSSSETIQVYCERTNKTYTLSPNEVKRIRFDKSGVYVLQCEDWEEKVIIEDAIRLGGSEFRNIFTFDSNPWVLLSMKDRTYFYNRKTKKQYYENDIAPEVVLEINKEYLLFGNKRNKDYALYSTEQRKIVKYLENVLLYKDMYIVYEKDDVLRLLYIYDGLKQESYKAKNYKLYEEQEILAFVNENDELCHYFLRTETLCVSPIKEKFISFLSTPHVVLYDGSAYYNILVKSLLNKKEYKIHLSTPIANCCNVSLIGNEQDKLSYLLSCKEINDDIHKIIDIEDFFLFRDQVFILKRYYELAHNSRKEGYLSRGIYTFEDGSNNILVQFASGEYPNFILNEDRLIITTSKRLIYFDPGISLQIPNAQLISSSNDIFYSKEENAKSHLFKLYNIKTNISASQISKEYISYGIIKVEGGFIDFTNNKRLEFSSAKIVDGSLIFYNKESALSYLYLDHILYRIDEEYGDIYSISKNGKTIVVKDGDQFRIGIINYEFNKFEIEPLVISDFDLSRYSNPLFTDITDNILCRKANKYILYNLINGEEQEFEAGNFVVRGINGYRPIIHRDAYRRPVLVDPVTLQVAPQEILSSDYSFVSPSGRYSADFKRLFLCKTNNKIMTEEEKNNWMSIYKKNYISTAEKREKVCSERRNFYDKNIELFEDFLKTYEDKDKGINYLCLAFDEIWENLCFDEIILVKDTKNDCTVQIKAKGVFWFKNYIAFSYDDKYVAIAARYPNETNEGGYFALYDLEQKTSIVSMTKYDNRYTLDAVWVSAFTKRSKVAFYTSEPHTFIVEPTSGIVKRIEGTSFLCYSPDGKYMALSNQGYIQYEDRWLYGTWGHQKSSTVYIYDTETLSRVKTLSCFFGEKITGVRERRGSVASVAFSQDNSQLLVSSDDGVVVIYNLEM